MDESKLAPGSLYLLKHLNREAASQMKIRHVWPRGLSSHQTLEDEMKASIAVGPHLGNGPLYFDPTALLHQNAQLYVKKIILEASKQGNIHCLQTIIDQIGLSSVEQQMVVHAAAKEGQLKVIELMVGQLNVSLHETQSGMGPLMQAAQGNHLEVCKYLINYGVNVNDRTEAGLSAGLLAARKKHYDLLTYLVSEGAQTYWLCPNQSCEKKECDRVNITQAIQKGLELRRTRSNNSVNNTNNNTNNNTSTNTDDNTNDNNKTKKNNNNNDDTK